ncbi:hypothetical protein EMPS_08178 [Entomortierella parvispora]|uniref:ribonuclease H n=1 Tax=Entomortierella parvispora TaxID=205924 RepID=A0A9P3LZC9_9FUNG|nr:hypothetical protein EMPS_08178 [Entomortierella parvispora]
MALNNTEVETPTLQFGQPPESIKPIHKSVAIRILGAWVAADGNSKKTKELVMEEINTVDAILNRKAVTDRQALYIVNNVLLPRMSYRLSLTVLSPSEAKRLTGKYTEAVRKKAGLAKGTPYALLHHRRFYGVRRLVDTQAEEHIGPLHSRLNDRGLIGQLTRSRSRALQRQLGIAQHPVERPDIGATGDKHNIIGRICGLMNQRHLSLYPTTQTNNRRQPITTLFTVQEFAKARKQLKKAGLLYLDQVLTDDRNAILTWAEVRQQHSIRTRTPQTWYEHITAKLTTAGLIATHNINIDLERERLQMQHRAKDPTKNTANGTDLARTREDMIRRLEKENTAESLWYVDYLHEADESEPTWDSEEDVYSFGEVFSSISQRNVVGLDGQLSPEQRSVDDASQPNCSNLDSRLLSTECLGQTQQAKDGNVATDPQSPGEYEGDSDSDSDHTTRSQKEQKKREKGKEKKNNGPKETKKKKRAQRQYQMLTINEQGGASSTTNPYTTFFYSSSSSSTSSSCSTPSPSPPSSSPLLSPHEHFPPLPFTHDQHSSSTPPSLIDSRSSSPISFSFSSDQDPESAQDQDSEPEPDGAQSPQQPERAPAPNRDHASYLFGATTPGERRKATTAFLRQQRAPERALVQATIPTAGSERVAIGSLLVDQATANAITEAQIRPPAPAPRHIYSDGSLIRAGTVYSSMAFGVATVAPDTPLRISGRLQGFSSSTAAELMGLHAVIVAAPAAEHIILHLDNLSVVNNFNKLVKHRDRATTREKMRCNHAIQWAVIAQACNIRQGAVEVCWVKGHSGDPGNEEADRTAVNAQTSDSMPWTINQSHQQDFQFGAQFLQTNIDTDVRRLVRHQSCIRDHCSWMALKQTKKMNLDSSDIHWQSTLDIVHNNNNTGSFYTSPRDSSLRSHRVKKLCGVLPTQDLQHTRRPDIYLNALCPCCEDQDESNEHLWNCDAHIAAERKVWTKTIEAIAEWAHLEEARLRRAWAKERDRHIQNHLPFTKAAPKISVPSDRAVWTTLQHITGTVERAPWDVRKAAQTVAERALQQWKVADLYSGISPHSLTQVWSKLFKTNITTAQNLVHRFCRALEEGIREAVWLDRCNRQIAMEKNKQSPRR